MSVSSPDQARAGAQAKDAARTAVVNTNGTTGQTTTGDFTDFLKIVAKSPTLITAYSKILKAGNSRLEYTKLANANLGYYH